MRTSSYLIDVPLDTSTDHMLIHGYTGAIDLIDGGIANFLTQNPEFDTSQLPCSQETTAALAKRGYITEKTAEEEYAYVKRLADALFRKDCILHKSFTFVVTYNCNFRCPYCFEDGLHENKKVFTKEMVDKAYRAIEEIAPNPKLRSPKITLYGGEPLLKENKNIISYILKKGREQGFKFSAITNGYDLDAYEDLLSSEDFIYLQITIDGLKERHNTRRVHYQGFPTFDKIIHNIGIALEKGIGVSVRVNTDNNNINDLEDFKDLFNRLHYNDYANFACYSALLKNYSTEKQEDYAFFDIKEYFQRYESLQLAYDCQDYGLYKKIYTAIKNNAPLSFRSAFCGSQTGSFVFDPFGNIYPCWEIVNHKEHCIGNYATENTIKWNNDILSRWRKNDLMLHRHCIKCKFALLCGGGCPASNLNEHHCTRIKDIIHFSTNKALSKMHNNV